MLIRKVKLTYIIHCIYYLTLGFAIKAKSAKKDEVSPPLLLFRGFIGGENVATKKGFRGSSIDRFKVVINCVLIKIYVIKIVYG